MAKAKKHDSRKGTRAHARLVRGYLRKLIEKLTARGLAHDTSKTQSPEVEVFDEFEPKLSASTYGTPEHQAMLDQMRPALDHHYAENRHHPQHFENGMEDMTLVDLVEMFCDWKAATLRHDDGDIMRSIDHNAERFKMPPMLVAILKNTTADIED